MLWPLCCRGHNSGEICTYSYSFISKGPSVPLSWSTNCLAHRWISLDICKFIYFLSNMFIQYFKKYIAFKPQLYVPGLPECQPQNIQSKSLKPIFHQNAKYLASGVLHYPTQNIPTCWYILRWGTHIFRVLPDAKPKSCVLPDANPRRSHWNIGGVGSSGVGHVYFMYISCIFHVVCATFSALTTRKLADAYPVSSGIWVLRFYKIFLFLTQRQDKLNHVDITVIQISKIGMGLLHINYIFT